MKKLNFQYRGIDETTDVLAFPDFFHSKELPENEVSENIKNVLFLGDIVVSIDEVYRLSIEEKINIDDLIDELFLHGILHLHRYDHQTNKEKLKMRRIEKKLFGNRPN